MDYLVNPKTGFRYSDEFLSTQCSDVKEKIESAIKKIERGNRGNIVKMNFKNELYNFPLYECKVDYKQGFRIYFTEGYGHPRKVITIGTKKTQKKDVRFCARVCGFNVAL